MQHLAMDDHTFSVVKRNPLETSTHTSDGGWQIVDTIEAPTLFKTARALDTWDLNVVAFKGDGMKEADALRAIQKTQEPVMITDGVGKSWGRWGIKRIQTQYTKLKDNGEAQVLKINIQLVEVRT
ncbi:phage tail protein [Vibrio brasiliensis]|uniref:phage tail protein n=1 Tax=Vibrio brasiliensis TaxID=170652 RepID=UPI001EFC5384|nr:phage tail protein [Vibrio brasiliensis]MCG9785383.1 phage tail protein [Vibrio brasiliensis]